MIVIGYCRVSTEHQLEKGFSLEAQEDKIRAYCRLHDHELLCVVREQGSGGDLDRESLQRVLISLKANEADAILVTKLDRLTRSIKDFLGVLSDYFGEDGGSTLMSISDNIDTSSATGRFFLNILLSIASWERETISERIVDVLQHKKATGKVYCRKIYGWDNINGDMIENEYEQSIISYMIERREFGDSWSSIARYLNITSEKSPCNGAWTHGTVKRIVERNLDKGETHEVEKDNHMEPPSLHNNSMCRILHHR